MVTVRLSWRIEQDTCTWKCLYNILYTDICMYRGMFEHIDVMCTHSHTYICTNTHTHVYIHEYTHTHIHIHICGWGMHTRCRFMQQCHLCINGLTIIQSRMRADGSCSIPSKVQALEQYLFLCICLRSVDYAPLIHVAAITPRTQKATRLFPPGATCDRIQETASFLYRPSFENTKFQNLSN